MQRHDDKQQQEQQESAPDEAHRSAQLIRGADEGFGPTLHSVPQCRATSGPAGIGSPAVGGPAFQANPYLATGGYLTGVNDG